MVFKWSKNGRGKIWDHLNTIFVWVLTNRDPKVGAAATIFRQFKHNFYTIFGAYPLGKPEAIILRFL